MTKKISFLNYENNVFCSRLDYKASVYCEDKFYGAACDVMCEDRDDSTGHYTCDPKTGDKICLEGESDEPTRFYSVNVKLTGFNNFKESFE